MTESTGLTVLITGVSRYLGSALAGELAAHPDVDRVVGVDAVLPDPAARTRMGGAEFARADIRNPLIFKVIEAAGVDTVVHSSASSTPSGSAARSMAKEMNVLGTMQLLAACQRSGSVRSLIIRSTAAVYGGSSRDPAVVTEETSARSVPPTGPARDAIDMEGYVRGFGRRRPDVRIAIPRFSSIIGPTVRTPLTRYFSAVPFVPVLAGQDARIQLVHELDAVALMKQLVLGAFAGTVNVAGDGAITIAQAIRRAGRIPLPLPSPALDGVGRAVRLLRLGVFSTAISGALPAPFSGAFSTAFSAAQIRRLASGPVLDTSRMRDEVGFRPRFSTIAAFDDFVGRLDPVLDPRLVRDVELRLTSLIGAKAEADGVWMGRDAPTSDEPVAPIRSLPDIGESPARPRLFSIDGDAVGSPTLRSARPGGRRK